MDYFIHFLLSLTTKKPAPQSGFSLFRLILGLLHAHATHTAGTMAVFVLWFRQVGN